MITEWLIIQGIIERGLIFALCVISMYITSTIIRFDDLSLEGSFALGGAIMAVMISNNVPWWIALVLAIASGAASGFATGILHTKLKLNNLISGIVVTTALFSINLKIAGSNMILSNKATMFSALPHSIVHLKLLLLIPLVTGALLLTKWFLKTEWGFLLHAVGNNPQMLVNLGKNPDSYITGALVVANALTSFCGALFVQYIGYFSIWTSVGVLVMTLAGLILSETMGKHIGMNLLLGSIFYQAIIALTFECNVDPEWNKLITALLIIVMIILKQKALPLDRKGT